ncbi:MAG: FtsW/RodA/SpoVE family cell cycle protein [Elusimicrobiota bacterium]
MMPEYGQLRGRVDWTLVIAVAGLVAIGTMGILSAASPLPYYAQIVQRHFLAVGFGIALFMFGLGFNYQIFQDQAKTLYVLTLIMMTAVLFIGEVQRGTRGWVNLGLFSFQPSELARLLTMLVLANYLDKQASRTGAVRYVFGAFAVAMPVLALILLEPDFSSTLPIFPMVLGMLFCAGANIAPLLAMAACGALTFTLPLIWAVLSVRMDLTSGSVILTALMRLRSFDMPLVIAILGVCLLAFAAWRVTLAFRLPAPGLYFIAGTAIVVLGLCTAVVFDHQLKGYQRDRFVSFLVPEADPKGASYNVRQAQVAIGSGGLWGKGVFSGTQSRLGFLPERHTDFVYAVIGEEMGFLGALSVLALYLLLLWRVVHTARLARDNYGYLVCCGVAVTYMFYLVVNVGMCLGVMPVAGIPLPLLSYGGSSLAVNLLALGIVTNIYSRRYAFY